MAINKVVDRNNNILIDLTVDTVSPNKVLAGTTFHGADGTPKIGTFDPGPLNYSQYNFIDYDGTLLYSYTDEELDALEELPEGPDHTEDNLTFQEWNWSLEDLKNWRRERIDRPLVGATYSTVDEKSDIYLDLPSDNLTFTMISQYYDLEIDWGDGSDIEIISRKDYYQTTTTHTYEKSGSYLIKISETGEGGGSKGIDIHAQEQESSPTANKFISRIHLNSTLVLAFNYGVNGLGFLKYFTFSKNNLGRLYANNTGFKTLILPKNFNSELSLNRCYLLKNISINKEFTSSISNFYGTLEGLVLPDEYSNTIDFRYSGLTTPFEIPNGVTKINYLPEHLCYISIPDNVESIGQLVSTNIPSITLDLSKQTKVLTCTYDPIGYAFGRKVIVPASLLEQYKTASYWSKYASVMVGV